MYSHVFVTLPVFWYFLARGKQGRKERRRMAQKNPFKICSSVCKHRFALPVPGPFYFGVQSDRNCCKTHMKSLKTWPTSLVLQMAARRTPPRLFANRAILWCGSCFDEFDYFRPSGTGRQRRRQALGTCGLSRRKFGAQKDPAMLMMPAAYPIRTL